MCAMPASGTIAIISAPQACGSICAAVGCASGSLTTLSVAVGKTAPHAMSEFYGFSLTPVNFSQLYYNGGDGGSNSYSCIKPNAPTTAGQCYCLCTYVDLCVSTNQSASSYARMCVICNSITIYDCRIDYIDFCMVNAYALTVRVGDNICIYNFAYESSPVAGGVSSGICISNIVNIVGSFTKGTTCCSVCRYTA